jgi:hypothetical protein
MSTELSRIVLLLNKAMIEEETGIAVTFGMGQRDESIIGFADI